MFIETSIGVINTDHIRKITPVTNDSAVRCCHFWDITARTKDEILRALGDYGKYFYPKYCQAFKSWEILTHEDCPELEGPLCWAIELTEGREYVSNAEVAVIFKKLSVS